VNLGAVRSAADLERALAPILMSEPERRFVAQKVFDRLPGSGEHRLDDVDAIAAIRLPVGEVWRRADLDGLRERARAIIAAAAARDTARTSARTSSSGPSPAPMTLLTPAQFRDLREALVVRTPGAFRAALFLHALLFFLAFAAMHVLAHARGARGDRYLLPAAMLLSGLGFVMLVSVRDRLIRNRTQLANAIRGHAAEFGLIAPKGLCKIEGLLERIAADETLPQLARDLFAQQGRDYARLQQELEEIEARLMVWHRADERSRRLAKIRGIGPIGASLLVMKTPAPEAFRSGRDFAAWIGLTPKDHSTAGKNRLGGITKAGDEALRAVLVTGATAVIQQARRGGGKTSPWLARIIAGKKPKVAAVALANKTARIAWKLMVSGEQYSPGSTAPVKALAA